MANGADDVLRNLRRMLGSGGHVAGDKLPPERELASRFATPRHVVREAIAVLEAEGKVWRHVGQGTFVGKRPIETLADVSSIARSTNPGAVLEMRMAFEPMIVRFAAQRVTSELVQELNRAAAKGEAASDLHAFDLWDQRFHDLIVEAAGNPLFVAWAEVMSGVTSGVAWGKDRQRAYVGDMRRILIKQHRHLAEAIENRDLDRSQNLMLEHWRTMRDLLVPDPAV